MTGGIGADAVLECVGTGESVRQAQRSSASERCASL
jgi:threonine dehydrogenase-like Zn-dependent dehydrogenase